MYYLSKVKIIICRILQWYFRRFPIRKGKTPILLFFGKLGLYKNVRIIDSFNNGIKANLNLNDWVQQLVFFFGTYEFEKHETEFWIRLSKHCKVIFDIGTNFGYYTLLAIQNNKNAIVYSFEPAPATFEMFNENLILNGFSTDNCFNLGVSDSAGRFRLYLADDDNSGMTSLAMPASFSGKEVMIDVVSIDDFVDQKEIREMQLVKIDVEGNELNVLKGMEKTLNEFKPILFIEMVEQNLKKFNHSLSDIYGFLDNHNYQCFEVNQTGNLTEISAYKDIGLAICIERAKVKDFHIS